MLKIVRLIILAFINLFIIGVCYSQDIITLKNGDEIKSKVLEVTPDQIKYKKWGNLDGPSYSTAKSDIFMIKYSNGTKDVFKVDQTAKSVNIENSSEENKKSQAVKTLENYVKNKISNSEVLEYISFNKTNGTLQNVFGQSIYNVDFNVEIRFRKTGYLVGNGLEGYWRNDFYVSPSAPNLSASGQQYMYTVKAIEEGSRFRLGCVADMSGSDNGFEVKQLKIKTITTLEQVLSSSTSTASNSRNSTSDIKIINKIYSRSDLNLLEGLVDLNLIERADKEYFVAQFNQKSFSLFGKSKLRFEQSKDFDDLLIGYEQKGKKPETRGNYMYYKGILFEHIGNYLIVVRKLQNGIGYKIFTISPASSVGEIYFEK